MTQSFSKRVLTPEQMDDPNADQTELARALGFLRIVNRRLGGTNAAVRQLRRWAKSDPAMEKKLNPIRILDVGTGSADIPVAIAAWAKRAGLEVHITGVDLHEATISMAREFVGQSGFKNIEIVQADALKLTEIFKPGEFHYAHAGLFLHHLQDIEVITVLRIMDRLTTRGVIWNDLVRGWMGRIGMRMLSMLPGVPGMAKHDGLVSVEAGFTKREAIELAQRAGWSHARYRGHLGYRFALVSEK